VSSDVGPSRRLVVGTGGSGRTYLLRAWVAERAADHGSVVWLTGHFARPIRAMSVVDSLRDGPAVLVLDDLQWFDEEALDAILENLESPTSESMSVWGSRRPWPMPNVLQALSDVLVESVPVTRTGLLTSEKFAEIVSSFSEGASSTKALNGLHQATAGSLGFAFDAVSADWQQDVANVSPQLVEAVATRLAR